jgi:hypothetical protein
MPQTSLLLPSLEGMGEVRILFSKTNLSRNEFLGTFQPYYRILKKAIKRRKKDLIY